MGENQEIGQEWWKCSRRPNTNANPRSWGNGNRQDPPQYLRRTSHMILSANIFQSALSRILRLLRKIGSSLLQVLPSRSEFPFNMLRYRPRYVVCSHPLVRNIIFCFIAVYPRGVYLCKFTHVLSLPSKLIRFHVATWRRVLPDRIYGRTWLVRWGGFRYPTPRRTPATTVSVLDILAECAKKIELLARHQFWKCPPLSTWNSRRVRS